MFIGKQLRLRRLWKHKRTVIVPFDHGAYSGPISGIEDPKRLTEKVARSPVDGILVTPGILEEILPVIGGLGVVLRLDGAVTAFAPSLSDYEMTCSVEHAVSLGVDAGIVFTFVGTNFESGSLRRLGQTATECHRWGLPLVSEIIPPSLLGNHFGREIRSIQKGNDLFHECQLVTRAGAELGADIIKTRYIGNVEQFRQIVASTTVPIIIAGGPKSNASERALLQMTHDSIQAGAAGIIFGRNVWQYPKMEKLMRALCAIVHEEESVEKALKILR
jgi:DhnA family fructose-bisphosphate aldolase class Ia